MPMVEDHKSMAESLQRFTRKVDLFFTDFLASSGLTGPRSWVVPHGFHVSYVSNDIWLLVLSASPPEDVFDVRFGPKEYLREPYDNVGWSIGIVDYSYVGYFSLRSVLKRLNPEMSRTVENTFRLKWWQTWFFVPKTWEEDCLAMLLKGCKALDPAVWNGDFSSLQGIT